MGLWKSSKHALLTTESSLHLGFLKWLFKVSVLLKSYVDCQPQFTVSVRNVGKVRGKTRSKEWGGKREKGLSERTS